MDSFTKIGTSRHPIKESDYHAARNTILRTYELFVRTKVYEDVGEQPSLHLDAGSDITMAGSSHPILACIDEFVRNTNEHGIKLLRDIPENCNQHTSVRMILIRKLAVTDNSCRLKSN
jgi:hypothetical protein